MSIKPVDMQITITKSNEVSKQKQNELGKEGVIHQQQAETLKQEADRKMKRIDAKDNVKGKVISKEKDDDKDKNNKNKKKNKENKFEEKHIIDIGI